MKVLWFGRLQEKTGLLQTLEEEARRCQWLVLWLDCDREGENIAYEVVDVCHTTNPRLNIWRAHFSALIERSGIIDPLLCALIPFLEGIPCPLLFLQSIEMLLFLHPSLWLANFSCSTSTSFFLELICRDIHHAAQHLGRPNKMYADAVDARQVLLKETGEYSCVFLILACCPCSDFFFCCKRLIYWIQVPSKIWDMLAWRETFDYHLADIVTPYLLLQQEIDLRIGASFTRFQTMLLADSFVTPFGEEDKKLVISYGPCQVRVSLLSEMSIIVYMWVIQVWILFFLFSMGCFRFFRIIVVLHTSLWN